MTSRNDKAGGRNPPLHLTSKATARDCPYNRSNPPPSKLGGFWPFLPFQTSLFVRIFFLFLILNVLLYYISRHFITYTSNKYPSFHIFPDHINFFIFGNFLNNSRADILFNICTISDGDTWRRLNSICTWSSIISIVIIRNPYSFCYLLEHFF